MFQLSGLYSKPSMYALNPDSPFLRRASTGTVGPCIQPSQLCQCVLNPSSGLRLADARKHLHQHFQKPLLAVAASPRSIGCVFCFLDSFACLAICRKFFLQERSLT